MPLGPMLPSERYVRVGGRGGKHEVVMAFETQGIWVHTALGHSPGLKKSGEILVGMFLVQMEEK